MRDTFNHINPRPAIAPAVVGDNTPQVGAIIDQQGFDSVTYIIQTGVLADPDATFAVTLTEGAQANMSDAAPVSPTDLLGGTTLASFNYAADGKALKLGYIGAKRFTQLTITPTGNSGAAPISAMAIMGSATFGPTSNPPN